MSKSPTTIFNEVYYDLDSPAAYSGLSPVYKEAKRRDASIRQADVEKFMQAQDTYTLHKPVRRHFPRNRVVAIGIDSDWQADLCDMQSIREHNDDVGYLLTVIDVLSKTAWAVPTSSKSPETVKKAFAGILAHSGRQPDRLYTDQGKEFVGKAFQTFLERNFIQHITSKDPEVKAAVAERYNRTLKTRIWKYMTGNSTNRYIDVLPKIVHAINHSYHRMIKMRPVDVNRSNEAQVWENLYGVPLHPDSFGPRSSSGRSAGGAKFRLGDQVRISKHKHVFEKGYLPNFTEEIFTISKCVERKPRVYHLMDQAGETIDGTFYEPELVKVIKDEDAVHKIEKVLKTRTRKGVKEVLVKWLGYPNKFNQWIPKSDLVSTAGAR